MRMPAVLPCSALPVLICCARSAQHGSAIGSSTIGRACRIAAIVEYAIVAPIVGSILIAVLFLNAFIGWYETQKAGNAVAALKKGLKPEASVKRDGKLQNLDASALVPGDLVLLGSGSAVPADCMVNAGTIDCDQAALTGALRQQSINRVRAIRVRASAAVKLEVLEEDPLGGAPHLHPCAAAPIHKGHGLPARALAQHTRNVSNAVQTVTAACAGESLPVKVTKGGKALMGSNVVRGETEATVQFTVRACRLSLWAVLCCSDCAVGSPAAQRLLRVERAVQHCLCCPQADVHLRVCVLGLWEPASHLLTDLRVDATGAAWPAPHRATELTRAILP